MDLRKWYFLVISELRDEGMNGENRHAPGLAAAHGLDAAPGLERARTFPNPG